MSIVKIGKQQTPRFSINKVEGDLCCLAAGTRRMFACDVRPQHLRYGEAIPREQLCIEAPEVI